MEKKRLKLKKEVVAGLSGQMNLKGGIFTDETQCDGFTAAANCSFNSVCMCETVHYGCNNPVTGQTGNPCVSQPITKELNSCPCVAATYENCTPPVAETYYENCTVRTVRP